MADDNEEFSELTGADIDTVHTVGKAANGTTILIAKAAGDGADGVFGSDYVRGLIAKGAEQEQPSEERLTPAQAMALIHAASIRKAGMPTADAGETGAGHTDHTEADGPVTKAQEAPHTAAQAATPSEENTMSTETTAPAATTTATVTEPVAKATETTGGLTQEQLAEFGRQALIKKAAKKAAKLAAKASGATQAPDETRTIPGTDTVQSPAQGPDDVTKAAGSLASALDQVMAPVVKQLGELAAKVNGTEERVSKMAALPDDRRSPLLNGAIGQPSLAMRGDGPTNTPEFQAVLKAIEEIPEGPAREQAQKGVALAALKARFTPGS